MADDIRIKDLQSTASYMESDDYLPIDSLALGNRKIPFTGLMDSEDDRLPTTDKTLRGAITEHEGDISEIKQSLSLLGTFYTYSWTANSSSAYGAQLTQKITLPKGNYILFGVSPVLSVTECAIALTSNNSINVPFTLNNVKTRTLIGYTFQVTQDNTDVWIMAGGSISVSYTGISDASGRIIRVG